MKHRAGVSEDISKDIPDAGSHTSFIDTLRTQPGYLGTVLRARCYKRYSRSLLFVDQFEELYTLGADRDTREAFVRCLEGVADDPSSPLRVILAVRSDFVDRVAEDRAFTSEIMRGMTLLPPLSREQLREALVEPLAVTAYAFESASLIEAMLDTLEATKSPLPLLQFTAAQLWEMRDREYNHITQHSYDALGGIEGALATHADAVLAGLPSTEQRLARAVFTGLVSEERTRAIVSLDELRTCSGATKERTEDPVERIVRQLAEARLVLMETDNHGAATVELIHESLIDRWPKLVHWLDEDQDAAQFRSRLRTAARQWDKQGRTEDLLWRGQAADEAERWLNLADTTLVDVSARDRAYLQAVVGLAQRSRRRRRQLTVAAIACLSVIAIVVSLLANTRRSSSPVLMCFWLIGALRSAYGPLMTAWLNRLFPEAAKATLFSLYGQADAVGQTVGGPVVGAVARYVSMAVALAGSALLLLPCVGAYVRLSRSMRTETERGDTV